MIAWFRADVDLTKKSFMKKCYLSFNQAPIWCGSCWKNLKCYIIVHRYLYTNYLLLHDFAMTFFKRAWKKTLLTLKISKRHRSHGREERRRLLQRRRYKVTSRRRKTRETSVVNTAKYSECDNFHEIFLKISLSQFSSEDAASSMKNEMKNLAKSVWLLILVLASAIEATSASKVSGLGQLKVSLFQKISSIVSILPKMQKLA